MNWISTYQLLEVRCDKCKHLLNYYPVLVIPHSGFHICWRCQNHRWIHGAIRNTTYEKIASKCIFPCTYEGCSKYISWKDVPDHENICLYRPCRCFFSKCSWKDKKLNFLDHLHHDHKLLFLKNKEECRVALETTKIMTWWSLALKKIYFVKVIYDGGQDILTCFIFSIDLEETEEETYCAIEVKSKHGVILNKIKDIPEFGSDLSVFRNHVQFQHLKSLIRASELSLYFCFQSEMFCLKDEVNEEIKVNICDLCTKPVSDSIHLCKQNQVVCKSCKCYCKEKDFVKIRRKNYVPCKNEGCPFAYREDTVQNHFSKCKFRLFRCFACAKEYTFQNVMEHCISDHKALKGYVNEFTISVDYMGYLIMIIGNCVLYFLVNSKRETSGEYNLMIKVSKILYSGKGRYRYRIELTSDKYSNIEVESVEQLSSAIAGISVKENLEEYLLNDDMLKIRITCKHF